MDEDQLEQLRLLVDGYATTFDDHAAAAVSAAGAQAAAMTAAAWYDTQAITGMATLIARLVEAMQRRIAAVTDAYLARATTLLAARPVAPVGVVDVTGLRTGVTHPGVYGRAADQYRWARSEGATDEQAAAVAVSRAERAADMDAQLAKRAQVHRFTLVRSVDGYRRVLRPELARDGPCGLCVAASDRVYSRAELLPLHDRCKCVVLPIVNGVDPGVEVNARDLAALYRAAGSTAARDLKRVRVAVRQHGELGPLLVDRRHRFRGPDDVAA